MSVKTFFKQGSVAGASISASAMRLWPYSNCSFGPNTYSTSEPSERVWIMKFESHYSFRTITNNCASLKCYYNSNQESVLDVESENLLLLLRLAKLYHGVAFG